MTTPGTAGILPALLHLLHKLVSRGIRLIPRPSRSVSRALSSFFFASLCAAPPAARAGLTWESIDRTPTVALGAESVRAEYPFKNTGSESIVVLSLRASCGCTVPELEKRAYAPGESGVITAVFTVGDRVGDQHSVIYVQTDDPSSAPLQLHLRLTIPQPLEITPRVVSWAQSEEPTAKQIEVQVHPESGIELTGITTPDGGYVAEVKPQATRGRYLVEIHPTSTAAKSRAVFQLQTSKPLAKPSPVFAFVR